MTVPVSEETLRRLRPFYGRVLAAESGVDEEERRSGLVVPIELSDGVQRGVVTAIDEFGLDPHLGDLTVGTPVYFRTTDPRYGDAVRVAGVWVLDPRMIVAYEAD